MKRILLVLVFLMLASPVFAADQNLTAKTADTTPTSDDLIYTVNDPGGTPADRKVTLGNAAKAIVGGSDGELEINNGGVFGSVTNSIVDNTLNASSGTETHLKLAPTVNQSGTAGYTALEVDATETSTGSGVNSLLDLKVGGSSKFSIRNDGSAVFGGTGSSVEFSGGAVLSGDVADTMALGADTAGNDLFLYGDTTGANLQWDSSADEAIFNGASKLRIPVGTAPTTSTFGQIAGDSDAWAASRGAAQFYDGTTNTYLLGVQASDTPSNGQVPKWNIGGTITWENDNSSTGGEWTNNSGILSPNTPATEEVAVGGTTEAGADTFLGADGDAVFNEQGNAVDFRVESDTNANMLYVDGTNERVHVGGTGSAGTLNVYGNTTYWTGIQLKNAAANSFDYINFDSGYNDYQIIAGTTFQVKDSGAGKNVFFATPDNFTIGESGRTPEVVMYGAPVYVPVSPSQITADQNDYASCTRRVCRLDTDASRNITGFVAGQDGQTLTLINVGSNDVVINNESASSTAANRVTTNTGTDLTLSANEIANCIYDNTSARWRCWEE